MPRKTKDLKGHRFSRLLVVDRSRPHKPGVTMWFCLCECGSTRDIRAKSLLNGSTRSCGCLKAELSRERKFKDITGQSFGRLTVLYEDKDRSTRSQSKRTNAYWICKCDCGSIISVAGSTLRNGSSNSCGCLRIDKMSKPFGIAAFNDVISRCKKEARDRGLTWEISDTDAAEIHKQNCFYCGAVPNNKSRMTRGNGGYVYSGIDRFDNTIGYVIGNVVPACKQCNRSKSDLSYNAFKKWIDAVSKQLNQHKEVTSWPT